MNFLRGKFVRKYGFTLSILGWKIAAKHEIRSDEIRWASFGTPVKNCQLFYYTLYYEVHFWSKSCKTKFRGVPKWDFETLSKRVQFFIKLFTTRSTFGQNPARLPFEGSQTGVLNPYQKAFSLLLHSLLRGPLLVKSLDDSLSRGPKMGF